MTSLTVASLVATGLVGVAASGAAQAAASAAACVDSAPSEAEALALAAACRRDVVVAESRSESSQVVAAADGTLTLQAAASPQRVRRADGSWTPINTVLARQGDGSVRPGATLADVTFSGGGSGPLVTWREPNSTLTVSWPFGPLPTPRLTGATATYPEVLSGINLHVTATAAGYTHVVEVLTPAAAASAAVTSLWYALGGTIGVEQSGTGNLRLVDPAGRTVATSEPAVMWDSSRDPARGGEVLPEVAAAIAAGQPVPPGEPATAVEAAATSRTAPMQVAASSGRLTVRPDAGLMADPGLTYPIFLDPGFEKVRSKWAYATSNGENNDTSAARVGRQPVPEGGNGELYRSYFDFDVSALRGKQIRSGTVRITLDHSYSCEATWVYLYRTGSVTVSSGSRMSWTSRPLPNNFLLDGWSGRANEAGGCGQVYPDVDAEFVGGAVNTDLQLAASNNWSNYAVGLCACNSSGSYESDVQKWKKFYTNKAWLEVTYNSIPGTPTNLTVAGQACGSTIGTTSPVFRAYYADADGANDSLTGHFEYQELPSGAVVARTGQVKPGNSYGESGAVNLPAVDGTRYQWRVRTRDAVGAYSASWSSWCQFTLDVQRPLPPRVSSSFYPADGVAHGGPGVSAPFTFTAGAPDVVKYVFGWMGQVQPLTTVTVAAGAPYTVTLTPPRHGFNVLSVYTMDGAGKASDTFNYRFLVDSPGAPLAHWPLNTIDGANLSDRIGDADLRVENSDVTWTPGTWVVGERTAMFDADATGTVGSVTASGTGVDTSGSFSVAGWVRQPVGIPCPSDLNRTAVSVDGAHVSGFLLTYSCVQGKWRMRVPSGDVASPTFLDAWAPALPTGKWAHLAGVWDEAEQRLSLWVNGTLQPSSTVTASSDWLQARGAGWKAAGPLVLGRDRWNDKNGGPFIGEIRDVRVWNRPIGGDDIVGTADDPAAGTQATPGLIAPVEVASWDFNGGVDSGCRPAISATYWSQRLELHGCTEPPSATQTVGYTSDAHDDNDALWLNHRQPDGQGAVGTGHAATSGPLVRDDQSVTVSVWARLAAVTGKEQMVFRQGAAGSALQLALSTGGRWQFAVASPNASGGTSWAVASSNAAAQPDNWVHLVGVFDAAAGTVRLYVNGVEQTAVGTGATGKATTAAAFVGSGYPDYGHLSGTLDQLRVFAGPMSAREITALHHS